MQQRIMYIGKQGGEATELATVQNTSGGYMEDERIPPRDAYRNRDKHELAGCQETKRAAQLLSTGPADRAVAAVSDRYYNTVTLSSWRTGGRDSPLTSTNPTADLASE